MSKYYTDKCFCGLKSACPLAPYNFSDQAFCFLCFFLDQVGPITPLHLSTSVVVAQNIHRLQVNQLSENVSLPPQMPRGTHTAPLTSWNMYESSHDTASSPGSNHEFLSAAASSLCLFLFLFRNMRTSSLSLDVNLSAFTVCFLRTKQRAWCVKAFSLTVTHWCNTVFLAKDTLTCSLEEPGMESDIF